MVTSIPVLVGQLIMTGTPCSKRTFPSVPSSGSARSLRPQSPGGGPVLPPLRRHAGEGGKHVKEVSDFIYYLVLLFLIRFLSGAPMARKVVEYV